MTESPDPKSPKLFTLFPGKNYDGLIVRYPFDSDSRMEYSFAEAAERLAATYEGRPADDAILFPWLFLYRHAIELSLKESIRLSAALRRNAGENDERLGSRVVRERLRSKHRHSIGALVHELNQHLRALGLALLPGDTMRMLTALATADPKGESFRYAGSLPDSQDAMDFYEFSAAVKEAYSITSATYDMLDYYASQQADWLEDMRALEREYEADMQADFESEMRAYED